MEHTKNTYWEMFLDISKQIKLSLDVSQNIFFQQNRRDFLSSIEFTATFTRGLIKIVPPVIDD